MSLAADRRQRGFPVLRPGPYGLLVAIGCWSLLVHGFRAAAGVGLEPVLHLLLGLTLCGTLAASGRSRAGFRSILVGLLVLGSLPVLWAFVLNANGRWADLSGDFRDWQLLGAYLAVLLPPLFGVALGAATRIGRFAGTATASVAAAALLLTHCRSAWIGCTAGMVVMLALFFRFVWPLLERPSQRRTRIGMIGGLAALVAFALLIPGGRSIRQRAVTLTRLTGEAALSDRLWLWQETAEVIRARPVVGWGLGGFADAVQQLGLRKRPGVPDRIRYAHTVSAHNSYLQLAAEQGLVGLMLFSLAVVTAAVSSYRALFRTRDVLRRTVLSGMLGALTAQSIDALANPAWVTSGVMTLFWCLLGATLAAAGSDVDEPAGAAEACGSRQGAPHFIVRALRTGLVAAGALWLGAYCLAPGSALAQKSPDALAASGPRIVVDYLNDRIPPPQAFERSSGVLSVPHTGGATARFKIYAVAGDGKSRKDVTGEGPARIDVMLSPILGATPTRSASEQVGFSFVVLPPDRGRQVGIRFRRPPQMRQTRTIRFRYRAYEEAGFEAIATTQFDLTLEPDPRS